MRSTTTRLLPLALLFVSGTAAAQTVPVVDDDAFVAPSCDPVTIFVDARARANGIGTRARPVTTIAAAQRLAVARDACAAVVKLAPGTYVGNIEVTRPLAIHGDADAHPVIRGTIANITGSVLVLRNLDVVDAPFPGGVVVVSPAAQTRLAHVRIRGATGYGLRQTAGRLHASDVTVVGTRLVRDAQLPCGPTYDLSPVPFDVYSRGDAHAILQSFVDAGPRAEGVLAAGAVLCAPIIRDAFDQISVGALFGYDDLPYSELAPLLPTLPILADAGTGVYVSGTAADGHVFIGLRVKYAERAGVIVSGANTNATFFDLGIDDTAHDPALASITLQQAADSGGSFGGLEARFGAKVAVVDASLFGNDLAGIYVHEGATALTLDAVSITRTSEEAFASGLGLGDGLLVVNGTVGTLSSSVLGCHGVNLCNGNDRAGVLVRSSSIGFSNSVAHKNHYGLVTQGTVVLTPAAWQTEFDTVGGTQMNLFDGTLSTPTSPIPAPAP